MQEYHNRAQKGRFDPQNLTSHIITLFISYLVPLNFFLLSRKSEQLVLKQYLAVYNGYQFLFGRTYEKFDTKIQILERIFTKKSATFKTSLQTSLSLISNWSKNFYSVVFCNLTL